MVSYPVLGIDHAVSFCCHYSVYCCAAIPMFGLFGIQRLKNTILCMLYEAVNTVTVQRTNLNCYSNSDMTQKKVEDMQGQSST